jgi:hypothetical protein
MKRLIVTTNSIIVNKQHQCQRHLQRWLRYHHLSQQKRDWQNQQIHHQEIHRHRHHHRRHCQHNRIGMHDLLQQHRHSQHYQTTTNITIIHTIAINSSIDIVKGIKTGEISLPQHKHKHYNKHKHKHSLPNASSSSSASSAAAATAAAAAAAAAGGDKVSPLIK